MMQYSDTCLEAISNLIDSRKEDELCFYYNNLITYVTTVSEGEHEWTKYMLPNVIIWDPMTQIPDLKLQCPLCLEDGRPGIYLKKANSWEKGQQSAQIPRKIWDYAWMCVLVGRTYRCVMQHSIRSYHAGVLQQISFDKIPFVLSHESGMTRTFLDSALRLFEEKSSFSQVRAITSKLFCDTYMQRQVLYPYQDFPNISDVFKITSPSEYLLRLGIQSYFRMNFWKYSQHFVDIPVKMLICDFIFHGEGIVGVANNRKWETSHDSLFIAANEHGSIKSFKFTLGAQFEQVLKMLASISKSSEELEYLCIDNCCGLRDILKEVFPKVEVKLHPSHVIKRLLDCVPTNHPAYNDFLKDLRKVFRAKNDYFPNRHQPTPSSNLMLDNLRKLFVKWKDAESEGWSLFTPTLSVELEHLKTHIENDCLSNIPPDNYDDKYRIVSDHISSVILKSKFCFADCQALTTHLIYSLNLKSKDKQIFKTKDYFDQVPIWSVKYQYIDKSSTLIEKGYEKLSEDKESEIMEACASLQQLQNSVFFENHEMLIEDSTIKTVLTLTNGLLFLQNFEDSEHSLPESFHGIKSLAPSNLTFDSFTKLCQEKKQFPVKELSKLFLKDGYGIAQTKNQSLYVCLELILRNLHSTKDLPVGYSSKLKDILSGKNVTEKLQEVLQKEMYCGNRKEFYKSLLLSSQNDSDGQRDGETTDESDNAENLLDTFLKLPSGFPTLAASACSINIGIIPLCENMSLYPIFPDSIETNQLNIIIYDPADHSFLPLMKIPNFKPIVKRGTKTQIEKCSCGVNDKAAKFRCSSASRCPCLKAGGTCGQACRCKGCNNTSILHQNNKLKPVDKEDECSQSNQLDEKQNDNEEPPKKAQKLSRRKRQSHALSFKTFKKTNENNDAFIDKLKINKIKQMLLQSFYYVSLGNLLQSVNEADAMLVTNIFLTYCKKFSAKLLECDVHDQDILDGVLTMESDDIQTWIVNNMEIHREVPENEVALENVIDVKENTSGIEFMDEHEAENKEIVNAVEQVKTSPQTPEGNGVQVLMEIIDESEQNTPISTGNASDIGDMEELIKVVQGDETNIIIAETVNNIEELAEIVEASGPDSHPILVEDIKKVAHLINNEVVSSSIGNAANVDETIVDETDADKGNVDEHSQVIEVYSEQPSNEILIEEVPAVHGLSAAVVNESAIDSNNIYEENASNSDDFDKMTDSDEIVISSS